MGARRFFSTPAETRIEEARIMDSKFANRRVKGQHLCRHMRRNAYSFLRGENVKLTRFENDGPALIPAQRIPKVAGIIVADVGEIDRCGAPLRTISDNVVAIDSPEIHG